MNPHFSSYGSVETSKGGIKNENDQVGEEKQEMDYERRQGYKKTKKTSVAFSPRANYTDRATDACRRS
jgi:hypothetical protein